ncbi:MAG: response regulator, partial [Myxococcaceae bacterium]|nr:response regulator [Myxococcaceae bacterium]
MTPTPTRGPLEGGLLRAWLPLPSLIGFCAALTAVFVIAALTFDSLSDRTTTAQRMNQTLRVTRLLDQVVATITDAETGQRGYLLTGDELYLTPYHAALQQLPIVAEDVKTELRDDPAQAARFAAVEKLLERRKQLLAEAIELVRLGHRDDMVEKLKAGEGKQVHDQIRGGVSELLSVERAQLDKRTREWEGASNLSALITGIGASMLIFLIAAAGLLSSRDFRAQRTEAWLRSGQNGLSTTVQGEKSVQQVGEGIVRFVADYLGAQLGALFFADGTGQLKLVGAYGLPSTVKSERNVPAEVDGLTAEALKSKVPVVVDAVPPGYFKVSSALGETAPAQLVMAPAIVDGIPSAVLELGFLKPAGEAHIELLARIGEVMAVGLRSARYRRELQDLLEETRRQSEELQTQQEELRVNNEELEQQSRALQESQTRLMNQQSELEQINSQLEEQTRALELQRDDLARAQGELQRVSSYKSEFLANMSHELRTPLNSSLILAKLLIDNRQGNLNEEQVKYAQTIYSAGNDLLTLINDILDLSKIEAGKLDVRPEEVTVARLTNELKDTFTPIARDKRLELVLNVEPGVPASMVTDPLRLQQVLKNLLSNALKFTERGGVTLTVSPVHGKRIAFAVKDTGIGIEKHQQDIIFEAFRQADGTTNRKHGGTGLGLSISRDLGRLLGGEVTVDSAPGRGSTFTLTVPERLEVKDTPASRVAPSPAMPAARQRPVAQPAPAPTSGAALPAPVADDREKVTPSTRSLLIIEDDVAFAQIVQDLAREQDFLTLVATTGHDGLEMAKRYQPSAIVLDVQLPDRSGLSVLDALKHSPSLRHVPVHMCSVSDYSRPALEMGAVGYAIKPVQREKLAEALKGLEAKFTRKVRRVLVVEDDERHREGTRKLLEGDGVETISAATAREALEQLGKQTFDCMVLDLKLPDQSGLKLLEEVSKHEQIAVPPVIVYTGKELGREEEAELRRFSSSIIIKGARSPERLLDEVTLFLHQVEAELPPERQRMLRDLRHRESVLENRRLLVVEDDVRNIFALTSALEPRGAKIEIARNGREALTHLEQNPGVDLVLMDIMMPEMD